MLYICLPEGITSGPVGPSAVVEQGAMDAMSKTGCPQAVHTLC